MVVDDWAAQAGQVVAAVDATAADLWQSKSQASESLWFTQPQRPHLTSAPVKSSITSTAESASEMKIFGPIPAAPAAVAAENVAPKST